MRTIKATYTITFDYSEFIKEFEEFAERKMTKDEIRNEIISCIVEDLTDQDFNSVKDSVYVEIIEEE